MIIAKVCKGENGATYYNCRFGIIGSNAFAIMIRDGAPMAGLSFVVVIEDSIIRCTRYFKVAFPPTRRCSGKP